VRTRPVGQYLPNDLKDLAIQIFAPVRLRSYFGWKTWQPPECISVYIGLEKMCICIIFLFFMGLKMSLPFLSVPHTSAPIDLSVCVCTEIMNYWLVDAKKKTAIKFDKQKHKTTGINGNDKFLYQSTFFLSVTVPLKTRFILRGKSAQNLLVHEKHINRFARKQ